MKVPRQAQGMAKLVGHDVLCHIAMALLLLGLIMLPELGAIDTFAQWPV